MFWEKAILKYVLEGLEMFVCEQIRLLGIVKFLISDGGTSLENTVFLLRNACWGSGMKCFDVYNFQKMSLSECGERRQTAECSLLSPKRGYGYSLCHSFNFPVRLIFSK